MPSYLINRPWTEWSREERQFCAVLYEHARREPGPFGDWLVERCGLGVIGTGDWDLGYEVCFYRDYLWQLDRSARAEGYSPKRTFDLCLFSENAIVVIEAKVWAPFDKDQNDSFAQDAGALRRIVGRTNLAVKTVALASSRYFSNAGIWGLKGTLDVFDGRLTWRDVFERYPDLLLARADSIYKAQPGFSPAE